MKHLEQIYLGKKLGWIFLTVVILITLHLKVFTVAGFDVSLALLLFPLWLQKTYIKRSFLLSRVGAFAFIFLLIFPLLYFPILYEPLEFVKTYGQYVISIFILLPFSYRRTSLIGEEDFIRALKMFIWILLFLTVIQYIEFHFIGSDVLYNTWGGQQLYYQLPPMERMKGFYLEPSYLSFVSLTIYWCLVFLQDKLISKESIACFLIILLSKSSFGLLAVIIIVGHYFFSKIRLRFIKIILATAILGILFYYKNLILAGFKMDVLLRGIQGGSAFVRLIMPAFVVQDIWEQGYYLGVGFGQLEPHALKRASVFGETGINNGIYALLCYFGLITAALYVYLLAKYFFTKQMIIKSFLILLLFNLNSSGAIVTPQYVFIALSLPLLTFQMTKEKN